MAQPIRNLWTPASAEMNKRGFLQQASLLLSPLPPSVFPFFPIPYPFWRLLRRLEFLVAKERMLVALVTILVAILSSAKAAFIMYTDRGWGGGGRGYFLNGQNFLQNFFITPPLDQRKSTLLFWGPNSISKHFGNWGNGLSLVGILFNIYCAIHYLEKRSVFDVDVDDVK